MEDPSIVGLDKIIETYQKRIAEIGIAKPARFASILQTFKTYVKTEIEGQNSYGLLLILTDGNAADMEQTKDVLVSLSDLPCSVVIVGLKPQSSDKMIELDGDDYALRNAKGQETARDIVQFVNLKEALEDNNLEQLIGQEIPLQVCQYMWSQEDQNP